MKRNIRIRNIRFVGDRKMTREEWRAMHEERDFPKLERDKNGNWYAANSAILSDEWEYGEPASFATPEDEARYIEHMQAYEKEKAA